MQTDRLQASITVFAIHTGVCPPLLKLRQRIEIKIADFGVVVVVVVESTLYVSHGEVNDATVVTQFLL